MKILISAAETSSDTHGAELLRALKRLSPAGEPFEAFGIGGPKLQNEGLRTIVDARELLSMGFAEVLGRLPKIYEALDQVVEAARLEKPDIAVVMDYPDFHFRLARRLKEQGIPLVYYIPPKVWAWRKGRVATLRKLFDRVLCILPFEEGFYSREGVSVKFVGNPLVEELPLGLSRAEARTQLGLAEEDHVLVLMPGSRPSEIQQHLDLFLDSATEAAAHLRHAGYLKSEVPLRVIVPFPMTSDLQEVSERVARWKSRYTSDPDRFILDIRVSQGDAPECMVAADAGLIKSGTSTLEAGVLGCPHAVVYRVGFLTRWIFKTLIRYAGPVGLVNLVAEPKGYEARAPYLVTEYLGEAAEKGKLAREIVSLFTDPVKRQRLKEGFADLRRKVEGASQADGPSAQAAREIFRVARPDDRGTR